jgi:LysM repeat protein
MLLLASCGPARLTDSAVSSISHSNRDVAMYTSIYADIAIREMIRTGVPASITLAQGIIESDYGRSRLATKANNHFGIKCHSDWKGAKIYHDDDRRNECFRKYNSPEQSFIDHSDFLVNGSRYDFLFDFRIDDYKSWAKGLKKAGYATNPRYASMLINTIEENNLSHYDDIVLGRAGRSRTGQDSSEIIAAGREAEVSSDNERDRGVVIRSSSRIKERNRIQYIIVREGDTYRSLAEEFDLLSWEIFRYNDLGDEAVLVPGQLVYIQPKRNKAEPGNDYHIVKEGETMYTISQLYGIKLKILYERNHLVPGRIVPLGTELWLRKTKPEGL